MNTLIFVLLKIILFVGLVGFRLCFSNYNKVFMFLRVMCSLLNPFYGFSFFVSLSVSLVCYCGYPGGEEMLESMATASPFEELEDDVFW